MAKFQTLEWNGWFGSAQDLAWWGWYVSAARAPWPCLVRVDVLTGTRAVEVLRGRHRTDVESGLKEVRVGC